MEEILKAVKAMKVATSARDPRVMVLMLFANASFFRSSTGGMSSKYRRTKDDLEKAEMKFEQLFKAVLKEYSPSTQPR